MNKKQLQETIDEELDSVLSARDEDDLHDKAYREVTVRISDALFAQLAEEIRDITGRNSVALKTLKSQVKDFKRDFDKLVTSSDWIDLMIEVTADHMKNM